MENTKDAIPPFAVAHGSANAPRKPIDIAHEWLKKNRQEWSGHISTWTPEQMNNYHRDLGLLVDFVTDCWPNTSSSATAGQ